MRGLRDTRDLAFVRLTLRASAVLLPGAATLFLIPEPMAWMLAPLYWWMLYAVLGGPVLLMVHALEHRATFTGRYRWLQIWICNGLPLIYGLSPFSYRPHHLVMHHSEENRSADLSSTLAYRRDSAVDFLRYWLRFLLMGNIDLARYLQARDRSRDLRYFAAGELAQFGVILLTLRFAPAAACVVLLLPYVLTRFFLMAGNWAQHAFVDVEALDDGVRNATILVNASHNHRCFNDGYHALHHHRPGLHWAEMSASFRTGWRDYAARGVIVFSGIANQQVVWWRLMRKDYDFLADHMLDMGVLPADKAGRVAMLQARVRAGSC